MKINQLFLIASIASSFFHLVANALYGIKVESSGTNNVVVRNSAHLNTGGDFNVATLSNDVGPVGQANSLSSPWGNIQH